MKYSKFRQLVKAKEGTHLDFKIRSDAFLSRRMEPKAELAKDVCAMANNGWRASYIVAGVSDDGKQFRSVSNPKLTEENVQSFCKAAVSPPPRIRVFRRRWSRASPQHKDKEFVIIQVGPHARQAFRLARDFISYKEKVCYRRNEVWIRRGSTSDLATPEEIARLVRGKPPEQESKPEDNIEYRKLPRDEQVPALRRDFEKWTEEVGGCLRDGRVVLRLGRVRYVWRYIIRRECTQRFTFTIDVSNRWEYEHGVLYLVIGAVAKRELLTYADIHFRQSWGWFTAVRSPTVYLDFTWLPPRFKDFSLVTLTLPRLSDTAALRTSLSAMLRFLDSDETASAQVREARESVNGNLRRWLQQTGPRRPSVAQTVLDLSAGRLP